MNILLKRIADLMNRTADYDEAKVAGRYIVRCSDIVKSDKQASDSKKSVYESNMKFILNKTKFNLANKEATDDDWEKYKNDITSKLSSDVDSTLPLLCSSKHELLSTLGADMSIKYHIKASAIGDLHFTYDANQITNNETAF